MTVRSGEAADFVQQIFNPNRLADVPIHSRRLAALTVASQGMGCHRNNRNVNACTLLGLAECGGRLEAVELWHLDIHEYQVKASGLEHLQRFLAVCGNLQVITALLEQVDGDGPA